MKHITPQAVALLALLAGMGLVIAGVYLLAGLGWSLIAGAVPLLALAFVIQRGLHRAKQITS